MPPPTAVIVPNKTIKIGSSGYSLNPADAQVTVNDAIPTASANK